MCQANNVFDINTSPTSWRSAHNADFRHRTNQGESGQVFLFVLFDGLLCTENGKPVATWQWLNRMATRSSKTYRTSTGEPILI